MKRHRVWWIGLALAVLATVLFRGGSHHFSPSALLTQSPSLILTAQAQSDSQTPVESAEIVSSGPAVSGQYLDPQERFQLGILEGYKVSTVTNSPLFESADGSLAYTLAVLPIGNGEVTPTISDAALVQTAQKTFQQGEGFRTTGFQPIAGGGIQIDWIGSLTQRGLPQPIQGRIVARQSGSNIFLLLVAATEPAVDQIFDVVSTLAETLQVL